MGEDFTLNENHLGRGWADAEKIMEEKSSGSFLKLEDGKSTLINVVSEPEAYEKEFKPGEGMKPRVKVDVWVPGAPRLQTWDMSPTVFKKLKRQFVRRGDQFDAAVFELGREGTALKTEYMLEYVRDLTADERRAREKLIPF